MQSNGFIFDLDGTLVDSVYQHVLAWAEALHREEIDLPLWKIHRKIGMSGGLFSEELLREVNREGDTELAERLGKIHEGSYRRLTERIVVLPGARAFLDHLTDSQTPCAIATSGKLETAARDLDALGVDPETDIVVTRDQVRFGKPDPDLFIEAAKRLGMPLTNIVVVGDSTWDMLAGARCQAICVGLLSGGFSTEELERSGALRVYPGPAELHAHLYEVSARTSSNEM